MTHFFSFGGGVQSTAALVLAARGEIPYRVFLFANVGDDSEHPATLEYIHTVAAPYAAVNGIELVELRRVMKSGEVRTLRQEVDSAALQSIPIPVFSDKGFGRRSCTKHYKIEVVAKEARRRGASKNTPATIGLGISVDEYQRMNSSRNPILIHDYPLIDKRLTRADCRAIIATAGLPVPPKSACWFCPFTPRRHWAKMAAEEPELFQQAVELEHNLIAKMERNGKELRYLSSFLIPLSQAIGHQLTLDIDDDACESGFCMT
jgi:hypothetical protein